MRRTIGCGLLGLAAGLAAAVPGCAGGDGASTRPSSAAERQDAILHDPMGYEPALGRDGSAGSAFNHDDRGSLRHDVNDVLFP